MILKWIKNIKTFLTVKLFSISLNKAVFESNKASFLNITGFYFFGQKTKAIKKPFKELLSSSRAFSIMGVLVSSVIGLIVIGGLTKMFVHMNSQISYLEKKTEQINLIGTIGEAMRNSDYCKETMKQIQNDLHSGKDLNELWQIRASTSDGSGRTIIQLNDEFKKSYGIKGIARFEVKCEESDCSYSSYPETKQWSLSLISQSHINNVPTFNRIMKIPLSITFTSAADFKCGSGGGGSPSGGNPPSGGGGTPPDCSGGRTWDGSACTCSGRGRIWNGSACDCPSDTYWYEARNACVPQRCPPGQNLYYNTALRHNDCQ